MRFRLLPVAAVVAVGVAACGGSSAPTTTKTTTTHKSVTVHKSSTTPAHTSTSAATTTSSVSKTIKVTFASAAHCTFLDGIGSQFAKAMAAATTGGKYNLNGVEKAYQDLASAAPSAIHSEVQEIANAFTAWASALSKANYKLGTVPSATQIAALEQASKVFSQ